jgi:hypothetical protein
VIKSSSDYLNKTNAFVHYFSSFFITIAIMKRHIENTAMNQEPGDFNPKIDLARACALEAAAGY